MFSREHSSRTHYQYSPIRSGPSTLGPSALRGRLRGPGLRDSIHSDACVAASGPSTVSSSLRGVLARLLAGLWGAGGGAAGLGGRLCGEVLPIWSPVSLLCGCTIATCLPPALPVDDDARVNTGYRVDLSTGKI